MRFAPLACFRAGSKPRWPGVIGILALTTAAACTGKITRQANGLVLALEGSVTIENAASAASPQVVLPRLPVREGDTIRTGNGGSASVMLLPGALLQLGPNSAARLEEIAITKDGNATEKALSRRIFLQLLEGTADFVVQFQSQPRNWTVETPNGFLSSTQPGTCRMTVNAGRTRLICVRGVFTFLANGGSTSEEIEQGCFQERPSSDSDAAAAETDARAQNEVDESLDVERKLLNLQRRERLSSFPWRRL